MKKRKMHKRLKRLEKRLAELEVRVEDRSIPLLVEVHKKPDYYTTPGYVPNFTNPSPADCGCPPYTTCSSSACPRSIKLFSLNNQSEVQA